MEYDLFFEAHLDIRNYEVFSDREILFQMSGEISQISRYSVNLWDRINQWTIITNEPTLVCG